MKKPIIKVLYNCPYCKFYWSEKEEETIEHIKTCGSNDELPKRDCSKCKHKKYHREYRRVGHDRGYQPMSKVSYLCCEFKGYEPLKELYCDKFELAEKEVQDEDRT